MGTRVQIVEELELIVARLFEDISLEDLLDLDRQLQNAPKDYDLFVVDEPGAAIVASSHELRKFAGQDLVLSSKSRRVIMAETDLLYGLSRMYQMSATQTESDISVCHSVEEAAEILDIPVDELKAIVTPGA